MIFWHGSPGDPNLHAMIEYPDFPAFREGLGRGPAVSQGEAP